MPQELLREIIASYIDKAFASFLKTTVWRKISTMYFSNFINNFLKDIYMVGISLAYKMSD